MVKKKMQSLDAWAKREARPVVALSMMTGLGHSTCYRAIAGDWISEVSARAVERATGVPWASLVAPEKRPRP